MKQLLIGIGVMVLLCWCLVGCEEKASQEDEVIVLTAKDINDGEYATNREQTVCPVCGAPIQARYHFDLPITGQGKWPPGRVYFDKADCVATFRKDPLAYLDNLLNQGEQ